jgi:hypothetical protein
MLPSLVLTASSAGKLFGTRSVTFPSLLSILESELRCDPSASSSVIEPSLLCSCSEEKDPAMS